MNQASKHVVENKFVKPKTRIPQQQMAKNPSFTETLGVSKNCLTLKAFLDSFSSSRRVRTKVWKNPSSRVNDSNSYLKALKAKRLAAENKRNRKLYFKQLSEKMERERYIHKREFYDYQKPPRNYYGATDEPALQISSKHQEVVSEKLVLSKGSTESSCLNKMQKEDSSKAFFEAEIKSTAVSCQEREPSKDIPSKIYVESQYYDYQMDNDISPQLHQMRKHSDKEPLPNNKSLLDEIYEQGNEELGDFMDSIPY